MNQKHVCYLQQRDVTAKLLAGADRSIVEVVVHMHQCIYSPQGDGNYKSPDAIARQTKKKVPDRQCLSNTRSEDLVLSQQLVPQW